MYHLLIESETVLITRLCRLGSHLFGSLCQTPTATILGSQILSPLSLLCLTLKERLAIRSVVLPRIAGAGATFVVVLVPRLLPLRHPRSLHHLRIAATDRHHPLPLSPHDDCSWLPHLLGTSCSFY